VVMKEGETVVFGPIKSPTVDWRWREVLDLEPFQVMAELKELDTNLFAARSELKEAARALAELEERLHKTKQVALEDVRDDSEMTDKLFKGGTKDERKERQAMYLAALEWVQKSEAEIKVARERKDNAQVAFDSLLDRQVNLGKFANMYSSTARLLASIQVVTELDVTMSQPDLEPGSGEMVWEEGDLFPRVKAVPSVDTPDDHDEGEYGEIEIPPCIEASPEEEAAMKASIQRYRDAEEPEDLPFRPDETISL